MHGPLLLVLLVMWMARKKASPGIEDLPFVDVDGNFFHVESRDSQLAELEPVTQSLAAQLLHLARLEGLNVRIVPRTGARRTRAQQRELRNSGASQLDDGPHLYGAAFDLMFEGPDPWSDSHPWARLGAIGKALGLVWGGDWRTLKDLGHFERRDWRALRAVS